MTAFANSSQQIIVSFLQTFEPINLKDLDEVRLLKRIDTKFVFHIAQLLEILEVIKDDYYVLEIDEKRAFNYESLYFDTDSFDLYKQHHNGRINRMKVRYRRYSDSGLCFFEVKYKVNGGLQTHKKRLQTPNLVEQLTERELALVNHPQIDKTALHSKLWIFFTRMTLVNRAKTERLTIDFNLSFDNYRQRHDIDDLVIAEVKTEKTCFNSPIVKALKARHIEEIGFSKYSMGVAWLENVKSNLFKPNFIKINKLQRAFFQS